VLIRALVLASAVALLAPAAAGAVGTFNIVDHTIVYDAGPGDVDQIAAIETPTTYRFTRFGGAPVGPGAGCAFIDGNTIDCAKNGVTDVVLNLGDGDDVASISPAIHVPVLFDGGPGRDGLFGGGGADVFLGGPGDDNVISRDSRGEQVDCGDGHDTAISDDADTRLSCEEVEGDADGDGVRRPADCDDTNPAFRPGLPDIPENGLDEDCSGVDAIVTDRDGDGTPRPQDCDDTNPGIHPGAPETIGNAVDENCDGVVASFPPLTGTVVSTWTRERVGTRNVKLIARRFPARTVITLSCTGAPQCPKSVTRTVGESRRAVNLHFALGRRAFGKRARIQLQITRATRVGRVLRYSLARPGLPVVEFLCRPPGGRTGAC
jgi:Putative metal-binding motif